MKTFETAGDVLHHAIDFHQRAALLYSTLQAAHPDQRLHMLLDYLHNHALRKQKALSAFTANADDTLLSTWLQYTPEESADDFFASLDCQPPMTAAAITALGQQIDAYLVDVFSELAVNASGEHLRETFANLCQMERAEQHNLTRAANSTEWDI